MEQIEKKELPAKKAPITLSDALSAVSVETTGLEFRVFCGMKKIELSSDYLKRLNGGQGKTIEQLTAEEKRDYANKWEGFEVLQVLKDLKESGINPSLKSVYFVKIGGKADYWLDYSFGITRAQENETFDGDENGIIVEVNGEILHRVGSWTTPTDKLIGGWCKVYRKDRKFPVIVEVGLGEFWNDANPMWNKKAAYLINKCAINHAYKRAYPKDCRNLNDSEVQTIDVEYTDVTPTPVLQPVKPAQVPTVEPEQPTTAETENHPFK